MLLLDGIQTLDDLEIEGKLVFLRSDLDSPIDKSGNLTEVHRIVAAADTIRKLQGLGARVVVGSRFGETKRNFEKSDAKKVPSIEPAAALLSEYLGCDVLLPDGCTGDSLKKVLLDLKSSQVCVLENLLQEELGELPAEAFARRLLGQMDVYVGDSVRELSRDSATTTDLPRLMEFVCAGPNLMRELQAVSRIRSGIDPPRLIIWGGNTLSSRVDLLKRLAAQASHVALVGVAGNTMIRALHGKLGKSAVEESYLAGARTLAEQLGEKLVLPDDLLCASSPKSEVGFARSPRNIPDDEMALDVGPQTQRRLRQLIAGAGTAIWCGTVGFQKATAFSSGTRTIVEAFRDTSAFTMVIGEDSVSAAHALCPDALDSIDCIAQGGAATLALLDENKLAGLEALRGTNS